jgi:hypothetical protein
LNFCHHFAELFYGNYLQYKVYIALFIWTDTRLGDVVIVVLSQSNPYHASRARELQIHLMNQMVEMPKDNKPAIYLTHKKWPTIGTWTIFPLLEKYYILDYTCS